MKTSIVKLKQAAVMTGIALSGIASSGAVTPANALIFNFTPATGTSQDAIDGFIAAGNRWSSLFTDNVTVNIDIDFTKLGDGILAQAGSTRQNFTYTQVYNALKADRSSADDNAAVANLNSSTVNMLLNRTSNSPNGSGSAIPYLDNNGNANNQTINMSTANAKALGLIASGSSSSTSVVFKNTLVAGAGGNGNTPEAILNAKAKTFVMARLGAASDASITFSNTFKFDFNPNNGIDADAFDFVGVATHEIGHVLGFTSGVDDLDYYSLPVNGGPYRDQDFTSVDTLDLFRYSAASPKGTIDWTADKRDKYFSLDGGTTKIASFSTGENFGDGYQASHWKDNLGLGIMDPTSAPGELQVISENDKRALDVIGWNRAAVPEPADFVGTFIFAAFGAKILLKRRRELFKSPEKSSF